MQRMVIESLWRSWKRNRNMMVNRIHDRNEALMSRDYLCFDLEWVGDVAVARFRQGNLDDSWINQLGEELLYLIETDGVRKLIISFNDMECLYILLLVKLL